MTSVEVDGLMIRPSPSMVDGSIHGSHEVSTDFTACPEDTTGYDFGHSPPERAGTFGDGLALDDGPEMMYRPVLRTEVRRHDRSRTHVGRNRGLVVAI